MELGIGAVIVFFIIYLLARRSEKRREEHVGQLVESRDDALKRYVDSEMGRFLDARPDAPLQRAFNHGVKLLLREGLAEQQAIRIAERAVRERLGVDPYSWDPTVHELTTRFSRRKRR